MKLIFLLSLTLALTSCADPFEYSSKRSAKAWGDKMERGYEMGRNTCFRIVQKDAFWKSIKIVKASFSLGDEMPYGGILYKVINSKDPRQGFGYMLFAKDTTAGQNVWRLIIYEKNKGDFNAYCSQTPYYDFVIE